MVLYLRLITDQFLGLGMRKFVYR